MNVWGIAGVIYKTKSEWEAAVEKLGDNPQSMAHLYDPRSEIWIYVNHLNKPSDIQMKKYLLKWFELKSGEKAYTARVTVIGKRPNALPDMDSDDDLRFEKRDLSEEDQNVLDHAILLYFEGTSSFLDSLPDQHISSILKNTLIKLRRELNSGWIASNIAHAKNIYLDIINTNKLEAFAIDNSELNFLGNSAEFRLIGIDYTMLLNLLKAINYSLSCSDFYSEYGHTENESYEFKNIRTHISTDSSLISPKCPLRKGLALYWFDIASVFLLGHETEHSVKHLNYIETQYKNSFGYFKATELGDSSVKSIDYQSLEIGADKLGAKVSHTKALDIFKSNYHVFKDTFDDVLDFIYPPISMLFHMFDSHELASSTSIDKLHPAISIREFNLLVSTNESRSGFDQMYIRYQSIKERNSSISKVFERRDDFKDDRTKLKEHFGTLNRVLIRHSKRMKI